MCDACTATQARAAEGARSLLISAMISGVPLLEAADSLRAEIPDRARRFCDSIGAPAAVLELTIASATEAIDTAETQLLEHADRYRAIVAALPTVPDTTEGAEL